MTDTKHTPGPWAFETVKTSCGVCHKIGPFPFNEKQQSHACIYVDYMCPNNPIAIELKANARLIAAAPELLEALEEVAGTWIAVDGPERECMDKVLAAIAKHGGEAADNEATCPTCSDPPEDHFDNRGCETGDGNEAP